MRFSFARRLALAALVPTFIVFSVVPGCSNESEGQRCGDEHGADSTDCADGLTCVEAKLLLNSGDANRCCPSDGTVHDSRCLPNGTTGTGGSGGSIGSAGDTGSAGDSGGGTGGTGAEAGTGNTATAGAPDVSAAGSN